MTLRIPAKVLIHDRSYDFYDMTLSTGKQRRHMINEHSTLCKCRNNLFGQIHNNKARLTHCVPNEQYVYNTTK